MSVKVGQIYEDRGVYTEKLVVSNTAINGLVYLIFTDGSCGRRPLKDFINQRCTLIAEYPSWQEAVNSKEFRE